MGEITSSIIISCDDENRKGGIRKLWIANKTAITSLTASVTNHSYSAITMAATNDYFYEVQAVFETKGFTSEGSIENGSNMKMVSLEIKIPKLEKVKGYTIQDLFDSCKVVVVFSDYNGQAFVLGYDEVLKLDASVICKVSEEIGAELQGFNGYTLTFEGKTAEMLREYTGTITTSSGSVTPYSA